MVSPEALLIPISNSTLAEIIRRKLDGHPVALENLDIIHPHLTGNVGEDLMAIFELNEERCIRQRLLDHAIDFDRPLFGHLLLVRAFLSCTQKGNKITLKP